MGLFKRKARRAGSKAGRAAKNVAKNVLFPEESKKNDSKAEAVTQQHTDQEYEDLKEKYDAVMRSKWEEYYKTSCDGECETCEYYDWCPDDFVDESPEEPESPDEDDGDTESSAEEESEGTAEEAESEEEKEEERELTEEELAAKEAAEAFYEAGCDGECETCEHYDWCPAEYEENPDDKVLFKGVTQGDVKNAAKESVHLAREGAMAARELKDAMDDIMDGLNLKNLTK